MLQSSGLFTDVEAIVVGTSAVVIYSPSGRHRKRFPEGCVQVFTSEDEARSHANADKGFHAALASGPSRSSEGLKLFYLVRWLDQ